MGVPVYFFAPHYDDETLIFGEEIGRHVTAGRPVTVVFASDGSQTAAIDYLNGVSACPFHGYTHSPAAEGRATLTGSAMSVARRLEGESACAALRVGTVVHGSVPDDSLTVDAWETILLTHEPAIMSAAADVFVPTPWETTGGVGNPMHGNAGLAMQQLKAAGHFATTWVAYGVFSRYWTSPGCPAGLTRGPGTTEESRRLLAAADAYRAWSPKAGSLGVGWCHSVPDDFLQEFVNTASPRYLQGRYYT